MKIKTISLLPAVLALGLFALAPANAEPDKNGGDAPPVEHGKNGGGVSDGDQNTGGSGEPVDTGGGHSKNGGGNYSNGGGGHYGNGGGQRHGKGHRSKPRIVIIERGGRRVINGGGGDISLTRRCYVGHSYITVAKKEDCYRIGGRLKRGHGYAFGGGSVGGGKNGGGYQTGGPLIYDGGGQDAVYGGGYAVGGGYGYYGQQRIIRHVPTSRAAAMQMERRARKAAASGYGFYSGGAMVGGGYGMGGGYSMGGGYGFEGDVVVQPRKKKRRGGHMQHHQPHFQGYNPGVVIHYGPVVTKGGSY